MRTQEEGFYKAVVAAFCVVLAVATMAIFKNILLWKAVRADALSIAIIKTIYWLAMNKLYVAGIVILIIVARFFVKTNFRGGK